MRHKSAVAFRRVIHSILFLIAGIFIAANLGIFNVSNVFIDALFTICWAIAWNTAAVHQLIFRSFALKNTITRQGSALILGTTPSTQSTIRASLVTTTAVIAMAMDLNRMQNVTISHGLRVQGSALWIINSINDLILSRKHEYRQEQNPEEVILFCNKKPSLFYALNAFVYLSGGVSYATALWLDATRSPLSTDSANRWIIPIPNLCWLLAAISLMELTLEIHFRKESQKNQIALTNIEVPTMILPKVESSAIPTEETIDQLAIKLA